MPNQKSDIEKQVEAAYDFRGHVTIKLSNGETLEGFVYNRQFKNPLLKEEPFIEVFPKGSDASKKLAISSIQSIELTGQNFAESAK